MPDSTGPAFRDLALRCVKMAWILVLVGLCSTSWAASDAVANDWPREIEFPTGVIVIYQPQPETLDGVVLKTRAAVSVEIEGQAPVFGAVWFDSRLETDRSERIATITDVEVTDIRFPGQEEDKVDRLSEILETEIPNWNLPIELDELIATLELADIQERTSQLLNTEPPIVLFYEEPAVLIVIDGEPRLVDTEEDNIQRVLNTPYTLLLDTKNKTYYLFADEDSWYTSSQIQGDWQPVSSVPGNIVRLAPEIEPDDEDEIVEGDEDSEVGPPPKIVVATEPTELISSTGKPEYASITDTSLLYVSNTDSDVLMNTATQEYYILLSGRWFVSKSLQGPWEYMSVDNLPEEFEKIPEDSDLGTVLYAVPGTDVAREAVLDAQIPQTAEIDRSKATLTVEYDGSPEFETVDGTQMQWAVNTATPVILSTRKYYAVDEAVWFVSGKAEGPWVVATSIPDEIYTIPSTSPIYNVTFVKIYSATDDVVYVGYTPGYTHTYVYNTTIVYGTGYHYTGWYGGSYYYPRASTWGFHIRWNPWTGWRFGLSYSNGPFTFVVGGGRWYRGGWWGPGRYRGYRRGYRHGYRRGARAGYRAGYNAGRRNASRNNMYRNTRNQTRTTNRSNAARNTARSSSASNRGQTAGAGGRANNVYADRNGNVHRQTDQGWQQRSGSEWKSSEARSQTGDRASGDRSQAGQQTRAQTGQASTQQRSQQSSQQRSQQNRSSGGTRDLNRSSHARSQGSQRASSYRSSGGGARRSGGGRR